MHPHPTPQDPWAHPPGLPSAESSSQLSKGCNSLDSKGGDSGPYTGGKEGPREESRAGSGQSPTCRGTRGGFLGERQHPARKKLWQGVWGTRESRGPHWQWLVPKGPCADSSRAVVTMEKAGQGEGWEPASGLRLDRQG